MNPEQLKKFVWENNPSKDISVNTKKFYHSALNGITKNLGLSTSKELIDNPSDVIQYIDSIDDIAKQKRIMNSIFYMLNRDEFDKSVMIPYYKRFAVVKIDQIKQTRHGKEQSIAIKSVRENYKETIGKRLVVKKKMADD